MQPHYNRVIPLQTVIMDIFVAKTQRCAYRSVKENFVARTATVVQENVVTRIKHVPKQIVQKMISLLGRLHLSLLDAC